MWIGHHALTGIEIATTSPTSGEMVCVNIEREKIEDPSTKPVEWDVLKFNTEEIYPRQNRPSQVLPMKQPAAASFATTPATFRNETWCSASALHQRHLVRYQYGHL